MNHRTDRVSDQAWASCLNGPASLSIQFFHPEPPHKPGESAKVPLEGAPVKRQVYYCAAVLGALLCWSEARTEAWAAANTRVRQL